MIPQHRGANRDFHIFLWFVILLVALIVSVALGADKATANCRPPLTVTSTDFTRLTEATDDFIEKNYLMANVTWNVQTADIRSDSEVRAAIYVGPMIGANHPGALNIGSSKRYNIVLTRECAADGWTVESFVRG